MTETTWFRGCRRAAFALLMGCLSACDGGGPTPVDPTWPPPPPPGQGTVGITISPPAGTIAAVGGDLHAKGRGR